MDGLETPAYAARSVVIDPGHGGGDPGAIGPTGYKEKDANLSIGLKAKSILESSGYQVTMTRTSDTSVSLQQRCDVADAAKAEVFVSIHNNSSTSSGASGTETFYFPTSTSGKTLASYIQEEIVRLVDRQDRGATPRDFYVLRNTGMPAALVEGAFLSNPEEEALLKDSSFQQKLAQGISNGILRYFGDLNPIIGHYVSPNPFSPNGDGINDVGGFYYDLSKTASVTLKIHNYKGEVKSLVSGASRPAGLSGDGWTGTDNSGRILPDGTYKYVLTADAGTVFSGSGTVTIQSLPKLSALSVSPNPFEPNGDGKKDATSVNYSLNQTANVTIKVFNYLGEVKSLISNLSRGAGDHTEGWTGTANNGVVLPNGTYRYEVSAQNKAGSTAASGLVTIANPTIHVSALHASPNPIYPLGMNTSLKHTGVCYTLNQPANVTITVFDYRGVVRTLSSSQRTTGLHCEGWTATNDAGKVLPAGTYGLSVVASGTSGAVTMAANTVTLR